MMLKSVGTWKMAFLTHFAIGSLFNISRFPAAWMRICLAAGVTLDADIAFRVAGLARLKVTTCLC